LQNDKEFCQNIFQIDKKLSLQVWKKLILRLNKYISDSGFCSRREADQYIENRLVQINGRVAKIGQFVGPNDVVTVKGVEIEPRERSMRFILCSINLWALRVQQILQIQIILSIFFRLENEFFRSFR
jgi:ribosomal 50S subunit-recycling heat shock protein